VLLILVGGVLIFANNTEQRRNGGNGDRHGCFKICVVLYFLASRFSSLKTAIFKL